MKWIFPGLVLFTVLALFAWPYLYVYRLDRAVAAGDLQALAELVDLPSVRAGIKDALSQRMERTIGERDGSLVDLLRNGVQRLGDRAIDAAIDLEWVYRQLRNRNRDAPLPDRSLIADAGYAFFESPRRFRLRLGEPEHPLNVELSLIEGRWKVTRLYD